MKLETLNMLTNGKLIKSIARQPFAWPGGYLRVLHNDGGSICGICVKERFAEELYNSTWIGTEECFEYLIQEETDNYCEHCNRKLSEI